MKPDCIPWRGGLSWPADWPLEPPRLRHMPMPPRLAVPIRCGEYKCKAVGTILQKNQALLESPGGPAAPTRCRIVGERRISLTSGTQLPAVIIEIEASDAEPALAAEELVVTPADLPEITLQAVLDRLQQSGVWTERRG